MKLSELIQCLEAPKIHDPKRLLELLDIRSLTSDSRNADAKTLFVAIRGHEADGHSFISKAVQRGLKACVVEKIQATSEPLVQIEVSDSRIALSQLACTYYGHPSRDLTLIGLTGTNGKTTTSYILEALFKAAGIEVGVIGTVNYRYLGQVQAASLTTPDPVLFQSILKQMKAAGVTHVISEISSHALKLHRVVGTAFDVALFTNLTQDHLDFHPDFEDYFESKRKLFTELLQTSPKKNKICVVNADDAFGQRLIKDLAQTKVGCTSYGLAQEADIRPTEAAFALTGISAKIQSGDHVLSISSPLLGRFNLLNILGALAIARHLKISEKDIVSGLTALKGVPGRVERIDEGQDFSVLVDYAHTDDALKNVGQALDELKQERIITVFGCGGDRDQKKRPLMAKAAAEFSDVVIVTSDNPRTEDPQKIIDDIAVGLKEISFPIYSEKKQRGYMLMVDRRDAIEKAIQLANGKDIVLIAGKGHEDTQILGKRKIHFDDREVAREVLCLHLKK